MTLKVIGLDIAKNVFQVRGVNEAGGVVVRRKLRRADVLRWFADIDPAIVGIEACHTAHYWARELVALGHEVRLMPPQFVKPYVKSQKNDAADAEAICEAVQRPTMRFVPIKSAEQQAALLLHRTRELLIRQRSSLISSIRSHFAEFGIVARRRAQHRPASPTPDLHQSLSSGSSARDAWGSCRSASRRRGENLHCRSKAASLASLK